MVLVAEVLRDHRGARDAITTTGSQSDEPRLGQSAATSRSAACGGRHQVLLWWRRMQTKAMVARKAVPVLTVVAILLGKAVVAAACTAPRYEEVFVPSGTVPADGFAAEIGEPSRSPADVAR
jgi:hypothetical protein